MIYNNHAFASSIIRIADAFDSLTIISNSRLKLNDPLPSSVLTAIDPNYAYYLRLQYHFNLSLESKAVTDITGHSFGIVKARIIIDSTSISEEHNLINCFACEFSFLNSEIMNIRIREEDLTLISLTSSILNI